MWITNYYHLSESYLIIPVSNANCRWNYSDDRLIQRTEQLGLVFCIRMGSDLLWCMRNAVQLINRAMLFSFAMWTFELNKKFFISHSSNHRWNYIPETRIEHQPTSANTFFFLLLFRASLFLSQLFFLLSFFLSFHRVRLFIYEHWTNRMVLFLWHHTISVVIWVLKRENASSK